MGRAFVIGMALIAALAAAEVHQDQPPGTTAMCRTTSAPSPLPDLPEASGVAISRRTPGLLWTHNDSGEPVIVAIDAKGSVKGRVRVAGATVDDWEDVSSGPCAGGSCLYVADIGDNNRARRSVTVYRVAEPLAGDVQTQPADVLVGSYPDGIHDAEALFVTAPDDIFIVTKASAGGTSLYRFPARGGKMQAIAKLPLANVTDAEASHDGSWVAVRTNELLLFYRTRELIAGRVTMPRQVDVRGLREPQGEGVAMGDNGEIYLVGEGRTGTLARLQCTL